MIAPLIVNKTALEGVYCVQRSAFLTDDEEELSPFSFRDVLDVFKKKDSDTSSSSSSSDSGGSSSSEKGPGIGAGIAAGLAGLLGVVGAIAPVLPAIGIGSKSRIAETNATAAANALIYNAQTQSTLATIEAEKEATKNKEEIYLIVGVGVLMFIIVIGVLFTRR